jgi:N-acetylneuraminic acid mutarotase
MTSAARTLPAIALISVLAACGAFSNPLVAPVIIVVNGAIIPAGPVGSTVTINGAVFGTEQGSGQVVFTPTSGGGLPKAGVILSPGDWTDGTVVTTVPAGLTPGQYFVTVTSGGGLTSNGYIFTVTPAIFVPSGLAWTAASNLPAPQSGTSVAFAQVDGNNYVYAVGGATAGGAPTANVYYATVSPGGTLGAWQATQSLPTALAFTSATAATQYTTSITPSKGFLYTVGGATDAAGTPTTAVYRAPINSNGTLGSWTTSGVDQLPAPRRSAGAIVYYSSLYVVGGAGANNVPVATVLRAPVQVQGNINSFTQYPQASLPAARARFGFGASGMFLYVFGGDGSAVGPNDATLGSQQTTIYYARLASVTHDITSWTTASTPLPAGRSAFTAVMHSNFALLTGGLYSGGAAEEIYAALNPGDGSVGPFTTSGGTIGRNLFNQGASAYLAGDGSLHVVVVGGDDVDAAGTRRAESFTY